MLSVLELVRPFMAVLPEIAPPERKVRYHRAGLPACLPATSHFSEVWLTDGCTYLSSPCTDPVQPEGACLRVHRVRVVDPGRRPSHWRSRGRGRPRARNVLIDPAPLPRKQVGWTAVTLLIFLVCSQIPLFGIVSSDSSGAWPWLRLLVALRHPSSQLTLSVVFAQTRCTGCESFSPPTVEHSWNSVSRPLSLRAWGSPTLKSPFHTCTRSHPLPPPHSQRNDHATACRRQPHRGGL